MKDEQRLKEQVGEILEMFDDAYKLSDEDWVKKQGDITFRQAFAIYLDKYISSAITEAEERGIAKGREEAIGEVLKILRFTSGRKECEVKILNILAQKEE